MVFRIYLLDDFSGHVLYTREIEATDSSAAVAIGQREDWKGPLEIWEGRRKLFRRESHALYRERETCSG